MPGHCRGGAEHGGRDYKGSCGKILGKHVKLFKISDSPSFFTLVDLVALRSSQTRDRIPSCLYFEADSSPWGHPGRPHVETWVEWIHSLSELC